MMRNRWQPSVTPMQTRVTDQPAFILHRRNWQNSSLILDVFTLNYGRLSLLAKAARQNASKALYQPFMLLNIGWLGRHELKTLTAIEGHSASVNERNYLSLLYVNELIASLLPQQESSLEIFNHYLQLLNLSAELIDESSLREFELCLLQTLGYFPDTSEDADSGLAIQAGEYYQFQINRGFVACQSTERDSVNGETVIHWNQKRYTQSNVKQLAKSVLRSTIDFNLNGKTLKSRDVYLQIKSRK